MCSEMQLPDKSETGTGLELSPSRSWPVCMLSLPLLEIRANLCSTSGLLTYLGFAAENW